VGCHQGLLRSTPQHICLFARDGFTQDDRFFVPCGTTYHIGCIRVGEPFRTRLPAGRGLAYPKVAISPSFICEACTVRAQVGGELRKSGGHLTLLMLERMRLIDQANAWSASSHAVYQGGLRRLSRFQKNFGVPILQATPLHRPPRSPSIGMMWAQQHYAIQTPTGHHSQSQDRILVTAPAVMSSGRRPHGPLSSPSRLMTPSRNAFRSSKA